jgi:prolyl 4-hydroxylase
MKYQAIRDIPLLSPLGFKKQSVPADIWAAIQQIYQALKVVEREEHFEGMSKFIPSANGQHPANMFSIDMLPAIRDELLEEFGKTFRDWVKAPMEPYCMYGIRSYKAGATLSPHVDRVSTHHVSAIVCVDKSVTKDWALDFCDHQGVWHEVFLEPGEMLLYESAVCQHARFKPLVGEFYNNLFVHYSLK